MFLAFSYHSSDKSTLKVCRTKVVHFFDLFKKPIVFFQQKRLLIVN